MKCYSMTALVIYALALPASLLGAQVERVSSYFEYGFPAQDYVADNGELYSIHSGFVYRWNENTQQSELITDSFGYQPTDARLLMSVSNTPYFYGVDSLDVSQLYAIDENSVIQKVTSAASQGSDSLSYFRSFGSNACVTLDSSTGNQLHLLQNAADPATVVAVPVLTENGLNLYNQQYCLAVENTLYVAADEGMAKTGAQVWKIDLTAPSPVASPFTEIEYLNRSSVNLFGFRKVGSDLYFVAYQSWNGRRTSQLWRERNGAIEKLVDSFFVIGSLEYSKGFLFARARSSSGVQYYDIAADVTGFMWLQNTYELETAGDALFVLQRSLNSIVYRINLSSETPFLESVHSGTGLYSSLTYFDGYLYTGSPSIIQINPAGSSKALEFPAGDRSNRILGFIVSGENLYTGARFYNYPFNSPYELYRIEPQATGVSVETLRTLMGEGSSVEQSFTGDPVSTSTGNFYLNLTDHSIPGIGEGLSIIRSYNSRSTDVGACDLTAGTRNFLPPT